MTNQDAIKWLENLRQDIGKLRHEDLWPYAQAIDEIISLLEEHELPTELKQKMWNALYAKEDECEKKLVRTDKHHEWFSTYRPWLQIGFNIAIDAIADWEGR